ncbi:MAG: DUF3883 domain-containing protein [Flavobacterium sp.]|nr:MAG: DUF3883 domain-containing protein [Flavobacterium sp.]
MHSFLESLIIEQKDLYKKSFHRMIADYNEEVATVKGYNGRQLLELLQNCDDEGSETVLIRLDKEKSTLSISNTGTPFSEKGYRSLFIANLSAKRAKKSLIGNKGLGFRSIIIWSEVIEIHSNGICLMYKDGNRRQCYKELFNEDEQKEVARYNGMPDSSLPVPFLTMPLLSKSTLKNEYTTTIVIHFKEELLEEIIKQANSITTETLLFLKNLNSVLFAGFEDMENIICLKEEINKDKEGFYPRQQVVYEDSSWSIFEHESELPEEYSDSETGEKEFYQIKIAFEESYKIKTGFLYSFFPTNILLNQPYLLHATFDLDSTRNQINNTRKNKFILQKVAEFTLKVVRYYSDIAVNYRPLNILYHKRKADTLLNLGYYEMITKILNEEPIIPCIDKKYRKIDEVISISNEFASMLIDFKASLIGGFHISPLKEKSFIEYYPDLNIATSLDRLSDPVLFINELGRLKLNSKQRAQLVFSIVKNCQFYKSKFPNKLAVLVNEFEEIIQPEEYIYTPATNDNTLEKPSFTTIQFLHKNLYEELALLFNYKSTEHGGKDRFIYEKLTGFFNIHSYEPVTLAQKIISETKNIVEKSPEDAIEFVREMHACLFSNFKKLDDKTRQSRIRSLIPVLNQEGEIKDAEELVFSEIYPTGKQTAQIFKNVYKRSNFIAYWAEIGLNANENIYEVQSYLFWIGINRFANYKYMRTETGLVDYKNYVFKAAGNPAHTSYEFSYYTIDQLESTVNKLTIEQLVAWIHFDPQLNRQVSINHDDKIKYKYFQWYPIQGISYILYVILFKCGKDLSSHLLDDKYPWVNRLEIDYKAELFVLNGIGRIQVNEILILLRAKENFEQLPIRQVEFILQKLTEQYPDGKRSQSFYKRALSHYRTNKQEIGNSLRLFADNGNGLQLFDASEIYFSDKIKLPNNLKPSFPIFNFPARAGGAEAIKFFKINDLKDISLEILQKRISKEVTKIFADYFQKLKPLILAQRIHAIEVPQLQKEQAAICNSIQIELALEFRYKVNDNLYEGQYYEFVQQSDNHYLIRIGMHDTLEKLKVNSSFIESFADVLSASFDVSAEKNEFKYLLRNDFEDVFKSVCADYGEDIINEAKELLGLADQKYAFWKAVFLCKNKDFSEALDDNSLESILANEFNLSFMVGDINYDDINNEHQVKKVLDLFTQLGITINEFAGVYTSEFTLESLHKKKMKAELLKRKTVVKGSIWFALSETSLDEKAQYLHEINKFENNDDFISAKSEEFKHQLDFNNDKLFENFFQMCFKNVEIRADINVDSIREMNKKYFAKDELNKINESVRHSSLLYFQDALPQLKRELMEDESSALKQNENESIPSEHNITYGDSANLAASQNTPTTGRKNGVYKPKDVSSGNLKEKGVNSEQIVFQELKNRYNDVYWAAEDNDGLHYDIRYVDEEGLMKFVEVKSFDRGSFYLSKYEYDFGKANKEDYEIWLVKDKSIIIPIRDFYINPKYELMTNEYLVYLDFNTIA